MVIRDHTAEPYMGDKFLYSYVDEAYRQASVGMAITGKRCQVAKRRGQ